MIFFIKWLKDSTRQRSKASIHSLRSLFADGKSRRNVANVFVCAFTMAAAIGFWTQFNGRWNSFHGLNIFLFAALAIVYAFFLIFFPQAFDRKTKKLPWKEKKRRRKKKDEEIIHYTKVPKLVPSTRYITRYNTMEQGYGTTYNSSWGGRIYWYK